MDIALLLPRLFWTLKICAPLCLPAMQSPKFSGLHCASNPMAISVVSTSTTLKETLRGTVLSPKTAFVYLYLLIGLGTWFKFIIKQINAMQSSYSWDEMSFYTEWRPYSTISLCFDVPNSAQLRLRQALASRRQPLDVTDVYASHAIILNEIVNMFDESVWALRDGVRQIEKVDIGTSLRLNVVLAENAQDRNQSSLLKADYPFLHDFARHVIHSTETLGVALDVVNRIIEQQESFMENSNRGPHQGTTSLPESQQHLYFHRQILRGLRARSEANQQRLQNEINFVGRL